MEKWKSINGFEGLYEVSNYGNIKTLSRTVKNYPSGLRVSKEKIRKHHINKFGYCRISLFKEGIVRHYFVHVLVAKHFVANPENKPEVNHKDCNKLNNHYSNLEWSTRGENIKHAFKNNLQSNNGEKNPSSVLNSSQVLEIMSQKNSQVPAKELAEKYNVSKSCIARILSGRAWSHLKNKSMRNIIKTQE